MAIYVYLRFIFFVAFYIRVFWTWTYYPDKADVVLHEVPKLYLWTKILWAQISIFPRKWNRKFWGENFEKKGSNLEMKWN
jgi:hypothetical protein